MHFKCINHASYDLESGKYESSFLVEILCVIKKIRLPGSAPSYVVLVNLMA